MSQVTPDLPDDARRRIDDHLDAIERVLLRGNVTRSERRSIVDEVETQIYEMLAARPEQEPAAAVAAILTELDPPAAYAPDEAAGAADTASAQTPPTAESERFRSFRERLLLSELRRQWRRWWSPSAQARRVSPPAVVAAVWAGFALFLAMLAAASGRPPEPLVGLMLLVGCSGCVGVTLLGFIALRRIRRSEGREYGLPLALIEAFLFPAILANLALIGILAATDGAGLVVLAGLIIIAANVSLGRYAWRRFGPGFLDRVASF
ncbi:MAG TPA: hypothetical protein VF306_08490 [Pirellulales bacterium]